ncbi:MAG TPA: hypothetical protein GX710_04345 [Clostridiales bacterium]|nr:hypothetical protein [Clostridiales bacterium]
MSMGNIIAQRLHEVVLEGEFGYDYTFYGERDKNKALRRKYNVNDAKMKEILLELNGSHFINSELSLNEIHPDDVVHVFKINEGLMPRFDEKANYLSACIYIKVTWPDGEEPMFIISFHEDEE